MRRMRFPYMRTAAPDILATAKAQRWDPAEVIKAHLMEEVTGRERSALATRRAELCTAAPAASASTGSETASSASCEAATSPVSTRSARACTRP